jgi:hypothetical protein
MDQTVSGMHLGDAAAVDGKMLRGVLESIRVESSCRHELMWLAPHVP